MLGGNQRLGGADLLIEFDNGLRPLGRLLRRVTIKDGCGECCLRHGGLGRGLLMRLGGRGGAQHRRTTFFGGAHHCHLSGLRAQDPSKLLAAGVALAGQRQGHRLAAIFLGSEAGEGVLADIGLGVDLGLDPDPIGQSGGENTLLIGQRLVDVLQLLLLPLGLGGTDGPGRWRGRLGRGGGTTLNLSSGHHAHGEQIGPLLAQNALCIAGNDGGAITVAFGQLGVDLANPAVDGGNGWFRLEQLVGCSTDRCQHHQGGLDRAGLGDAVHQGGPFVAERPNCLGRRRQCVLVKPMNAEPQGLHRLGHGLGALPVLQHDPDGRALVSGEQVQLIVE